MINFRRSPLYLTILLLSAKGYAAGTESNVFQVYDNFLALSYTYGTNQNVDTSSYIGLAGEMLLDNNIWLSANVNTLLTYDLSNNNRGLANLYQNKSGSSFGLRGGYGFNVERFNFIPYIGFNYSNLLIAYNYDSSQQFIFENPSFNTLAGFITEYDLVHKKLKLGLDTNLTYSMHKAVLPSTPDTLGHIDYDNYVFTIQPEIQYNITSRITLIGAYGLSTKFGGNATPDNVYYPQISTSSSNVINNDGIINFFSLKVGMLF